MKISSVPRNYLPREKTSRKVVTSAADSRLTYVIFTV